MKFKKKLLIVMFLLISMVLCSCGNKELSENKILEQLNGKAIVLSYMDNYYRQKYGDQSLIINNAIELKITERFTKKEQGSDQVNGILKFSNADIIVEMLVSVNLSEFDEGWKIINIVGKIKDEDDVKVVGFTDTSVDFLNKYMTKNDWGIKALDIKDVKTEENYIVFEGEFEKENTKEPVDTSRRNNLYIYAYINEDSDDGFYLNYFLE